MNPLTLIFCVILLFTTSNLKLEKGDLDMSCQLFARKHHALKFFLVGDPASPFLQDHHFFSKTFPNSKGKDLSKDKPEESADFRLRLIAFFLLFGLLTLVFCRKVRKKNFPPYT